MNRSLFGAISLVISSVYAQQIYALEYHGYMRSGLGFGENSTDQVCFSTPGAPEKFRLGNECDTYIEAMFVQDFAAKEKDNKGPTWKGHLTLALLSGGQRDFESTAVDIKTAADGKVSGSSTASLALREAFVAAGSVVSPGSTLWIGKKYYRRKDIHILDFYYLDNSGPGFGLENFAMGPGQLHTALTHNIPKDGGPAQKNFDLRYSDLPLGPGRLETALLYGLVGQTDSQTGVEAYEAQSGLSLQLFYTLPVGKTGNNMLALQYGKGLYGAHGEWGASLMDQRGGFGSQNIAKGNQDLVDQRRESSSFRVIDNLNFDRLTDTWSLDAVALYQELNFNGQKNLTSLESIPHKKELTVGVRPIAQISPTFAFVSELGTQQVQNAFYDTSSNSYKNASMSKVTLAPSFVPSAGLWIRPALRFFVTYATWNKEAKGKVAQGLADNQNLQGVSVGSQLEAWW